MKYIFRGNVIFSYDPETKVVTQQKVNGRIAGFDYCRFINEDYKLLSEFFDLAYRHGEGIINKTGLKDFDVH